MLVSHNIEYKILIFKLKLLNILNCLVNSALRKKKRKIIIYNINNALFYIILPVFLIRWLLLLFGLLFVVCLVLSRLNTKCMSIEPTITEIIYSPY